MVFSNNLLMGAGGQSSGYEIDQSIRFNNDDSAHLSKTFGSAGDRKTWTVSVWVKRSGFGTREVIFAATGQGFLQLGPDAESTESITLNNEGSGTDLNWYTDPVYHDPGAWFHIVWQFDSTQAVADNRAKLWVNGSQITSFTKVATPAQNFEGGFNNAVEHKIGEGHIANFYLDAYLAEMHFIDGTAKEASDFGEYNTDGVWIAKTYEGAYGGNGFYLKGQDSSALGDDTSGNGNDFASSGLAAADQMSDTPTNNHCTYNPLRIRGTNTLSDGNLQAAAGSAGAYVTSTFGVSSGKWYWEYTFTGTYNFPIVGIMGTALYQDAYPSQLTNAVLYYSSNGNKYIDSTGSSYGASYAVSDKIGVALNLDDNEITFFKNNSTQGAISISNREYTPLVGEEGSSNGGIIANFGQSDFEYTPPTGFKKLNTSNLPTPTISDGSKYFQTTLYTGNGSTQSINQSGENSTFQPDFVWIKGRGIAVDHALYDVVRGATKEIKSNATDVEATISNGVTAFESDGFALGDRIGVNANTQPFVAWQWLAGNSAGSTNDDGSVDSTVTVNTTAGFSICKLNPGGNSNITFGHGLGVAPRLVMVKDLEDATNWQVLHLDQGVGNKLFLNTNAAAASDANMWQNTAPTSTVVSMGTAQTTNEQFIAYCFAEIPGYSSIRSYVGNGSTDGPFVYTGFKPAFVIFKNISASSQDWEMFDNKRDGLNDANRRLYPNTNDVEPSASNRVRLTSNGFKIVTSGGTHVNGSGNTIIYMAFAEHPFGGSGLAPATAR